MWPRRERRPKVATTLYGSYLRGKLVGLGLGLGLDGEAALYGDEAVPVEIRTAFAIGVAAKRHAPILAARQVERKTAELVDLAELVAEVEGDDDPGSGTPPAAPPPGGVGVEETARVQTTRWIGDPLPSPVS